jgi:endonuclease YncB( thermonuclease family)
MYCWNILKRGSCFKKPTNVGDVKSYNEVIEKNFDEYLYHVEYKDTIRFIPPILNGKVIKVYDGDTITIASKIQNTNLPIYRFPVRLSRIDSAEIKGATNAEKEAAIKARDALHKLIFGKIVTLKNVGTEKYGRVLADVYLGEIDVSKWMLDNNYAVPYDGGKKMRPVEWDNEI